LLRTPSIPKPVLITLLGCALLAAQAIRNIPWREGLDRPPTPLDRSTARALGPGWTLLTSARGLIPEGASVVVRTEPPDATMETWYHRLGVSLLTGRRTLPSAYLYQFTSPEIWREAEYLVLVGPSPAAAPGELLLKAPEGTVWRRRRP
jgi:hypothetical protein